MPTHTLTEDCESGSLRRLTFAYCDSGVPLDKKNYKTLIFLHGLGFNANIFERLFPLANENGLRIIAIHRRSYSQSTPFSTPELQIIHNGTLSEKSDFWDSQGKVLAQVVAELIVRLNLGEVALVGWSLGSTFLLYVINECAALHELLREELVEHVLSVIIWDPPPTAFGFVAPPNAYIPLLDESIPPEIRARRFNEYASSYFTHKCPIADMTANGSDASIENSISYQPDTDKVPSVTTMSSEELNRIIDTPASYIDRTIGESSFLEDGRGRTVLQNKVRNALINSETRALWKNTTFVCLYGDRNGWYAPVVFHGLQKLLKEANDPERLKTTFKVIKGANHFVMWDDPELTLRSLAECL